MSGTLSNAGRWRPGHSGNPKGRPRKDRVLTEILRTYGEQLVAVSGEERAAQQALAEAVWKVILTGEVWLNGERLEVTSVGEWFAVVNWLYQHLEPTQLVEPEPESEMVVRVVYDDDDHTLN